MEYRGKLIASSSTKYRELLTILGPPARESFWNMIYIGINYEIIVTAFDDPYAPPFSFEIRYRYRNKL
jgi:hypothetical protein